MPERPLRHQYHMSQLSLPPLSRVITNITEFRASRDTYSDLLVVAPYGKDKEESESESRWLLQRESESINLYKRTIVTLA